MPHLELRNVEKKYSSETEAVRGITLAAEKGEFVVLVGPSGCGKSTILRMVAGLEYATGGDILISGKRVNDLPPKDRDIAMVFQNYALYPHLSVRENIGFPLLIRKETIATIESEVQKAADMLSIKHLLDRKPKELSGGERQRVALGRAIVRKPQVFLFDEPLSNLDAALRAEMRAELKELQQRLATTMLYVTHDQTEAMTMGDRIAVLNKGKLEQFDTPENIYRRPQTTFVGRFLGSPSMNLLNGSVEGNFFVSNGFQLRVEREISALKKDVILGIRSEAISVAQRWHSANPSEGELIGKLTLVEPLGSVTNYYIEATLPGNLMFIASVKGFASQSEMGVGDECTLTIPASEVHFFDVVTGSRI
jgi:ABC-type sugar transport system ATPase subunit